MQLGPRAYTAGILWVMCVAIWQPGPWWDRTGPVKWASDVDTVPAGAQAVISTDTPADDTQAAADAPKRSRSRTRKPATAATD